MTTHRSWFPFILLGLSTALLAIVVVVYKGNTPQTDTPQTETPVTAPTPGEYETAVKNILAAYRASNDAQASYDALIATRVPSTAYQDVHLDLVIAFAQLASGNADDGAAQLAATLAASPWLGM